MVSTTRAAKMAAIAGACALATAVAPAGADEVKPVPTTCEGAAFTDAAGDQSSTPTRFQGQSVPSARKARENLDVLGGFLRYVPEGDRNVLTANIQIANLDKELDAGATSAGWYFKFKLGDVLHYVVATVDGDGVEEYAYGTQAGSSLTEVGTTTGKLFEGQDGVVQIVVPAALKLDGKTMADPYAAATFIQGTGAVGPYGGASLSSTADNGPDDTTAGKDFVVTPCAEPGVQTPVGTTPAPVVTTPPPAVVAPAAIGPATLDLEVRVGKLSARKVARKRAFTVTLQAGERLTGFTARLLKGTKKVGSGRLAAAGPGAARLKVRTARKLKKGTYRLAFTATKADGRTASGSVAIRIAK